MRNEVICNDTRIQQIVPTKILSYEESLQLAFDKISQKSVISSWKDAISLNMEYSLTNDKLNLLEIGKRSSKIFGALAVIAVGILAIGCGAFAE